MLPFYPHGTKHVLQLDMKQDDGDVYVYDLKVDYYQVHKWKVRRLLLGQNVTLSLCAD